jgi:SH3-like domain-containing protein
MAPDAEQEHVVVLVHGIRDYALWQSRVRSELESAGFVVEPTNYGRFGLVQFLAPVPFFRRWAVDQIGEEIRIVKQSHRGARFSIIAHSFGTYIIASLIKNTFDLNASRIIFCGSVVSYRFRFQDYEGRFIAPILNEVGTRDVWPAIAQSVTWGYGSAGTYGFRRPLIRDRWHNGAGHGHFLNKGFCTKFWIPFLKDGSVVKADDDPEPPRPWLSVLSLVRVKYLVLAALAYAALAYGRPVYEHFASPQVRSWQTWPWPKPQAACLAPNERWDAASCDDPEGKYIVAEAPWDDDDHGLNVRAGAGTTERKIGLLPPNQTQIALGACTGTWCEISCKSKNLTGYVGKGYLKLQSDALGQTTGLAASQPLPVRNGPFATCATVGSLPAHAANVITHICQTSPVGTSQWCLVTYQSVSGWVQSVDLRPQPPN